MDDCDSLVLKNRKSSKLSSDFIVVIVNPIHPIEQNNRSRKSQSLSVNGP